MEAAAAVFRGEVASAETNPALSSQDGNSAVASGLRPASKRAASKLSKQSSRSSKKDSKATEREAVQCQKAIDREVARAQKEADCRREAPQTVCQVGFPHFTVQH